jgi:hypothetical protein
VEIHMKVLKLWSALLGKFFGQRFEQDHLSLQIADHFALHCEHLFAHVRMFFTIVLHFLRSLHFGYKLAHNSQLISATLMFLVWRKWINSTNFTAGRIIKHKTHHNSLCRDKNKHYMTSYVMVYEVMESCDATLHVQSVPCSCISCLNKLRVLPE